MDSNTLFYLPEEVIEEILSNLPVKSLLKFRCVSKSWRCLIGSNRFIKTHLQKSRSHKLCERWAYIVIPNSQNPNPPRIKRLSVRLDGLREDLISIDDPINHHLIRDTKIMGHSNGLVCVRNSPTLFILWNPSTRISIQLPELDCDNFEFDNVKKLGFGWDSESDAYKVFVVLSKKEIMMGKLYNSKTNSWKTMEEYGSVDLVGVDGEFGVGNIHWLVRGDGGYVETFDLRSEVFGRIELPREQIAVGDIVLKSWIQSDICIVYFDSDKKTSKIWNMVGRLGEEEDWVQLPFAFPDLRSSSMHKSCNCVESLVVLSPL